ncbi:MAG: glycoside hydrolase family 27 protein, partial [Erysipelothrix sp.]|nr:glycoside hydrolase family 27 protein [Erysipelothrix sp.]
MKFNHAPKGWNSWDCYGASVTEAEVIANAEVLKSELFDLGWDTVVVDIQWYEPTANSSMYHKFADLEMDAYSRLMPAVNRFPSSADGVGFKVLGQKIHDMGLKFGIHIMRGIPRQAVHRNTPLKGTEYTARDIAHPNSIAPWNTDMYGVDPNHPGSQMYYDSIFELYASWGVDYIKVDDIADSKIYGGHLPEIEMIQKAIQNSGRDMVLSLSPGPANIEHAEFMQEHANLWRMTDDFWDLWELLYGMFERCRIWAPYVKEGSYPDADML